LSIKKSINFLKAKISWESRYLSAFAKRASLIFGKENRGTKSGMEMRREFHPKSRKFAAIFKIFQNWSAIFQFRRQTLVFFTKNIAIRGRNNQRTKQCHIFHPKKRARKAWNGSTGTGE
jgi:hypothetical protein